MKIACIGGGPAGLYFSILMKRCDSDHDITVFERNPAGSTYGWGVTYWANLLDTLREYDPETARAISESSLRWSGGEAYVHGEITAHRGDDGFGIGRHRLLEILSHRAAELGVRLHFNHEIEDLAELPKADLILAADGVHSRVRQLHPDQFRPDVAVGRNKYIWLGTRKVFDAFTFAFVETPFGWIWCYGYGYSEELSTFIVECAPETWAGLGFDRLGEEETLTLLEQLFAKPLDGHSLISRANGGGVAASWLNFRTMTNAVWHHQNIALLGDAAHTTHYSIGAGTKLALEDAISLVGALRSHPGDLPTALAAYERERRFALLSFQSAARYSAQWYENIPRYVQLPPPHLFALLGQRHSPLLPHVPPQLYYRIHQATEQLDSLRRLRKWLGPRLARTLQRS